MNKFHKESTFILVHYSSLLLLSFQNEVRGRASGQEDSEEFDDYVTTANPLPLPPKCSIVPKSRVISLERIQDGSLHHEKLPDNLVPTSQSNVFIRERSEININNDKSNLGQSSNLNHMHKKDNGSAVLYKNISIGIYFIYLLSLVCMGYYCSLRLKIIYTAENLSTYLLGLRRFWELWRYNFEITHGHQIVHFMTTFK